MSPLRPSSLVPTDFGTWTFNALMVDLRSAVVPAFVGAAGELVLVDDDFELVGAELGGEGVDAAFVEGAVVAVADEDFGHGR